MVRTVSKRQTQKHDLTPGNIVTLTTTFDLAGTLWFELEASKVELIYQYICIYSGYLAVCVVRITVLQAGHWKVSMSYNSRHIDTFVLFIHVFLLNSFGHLLFHKNRTSLDLKGFVYQHAHNHFFIYIFFKCQNNIHRYIPLIFEISPRVDRHGASNVSLCFAGLSKRQKKNTGSLQYFDSITIVLENNSHRHIG